MPEKCNLPDRHDPMAALAARKRIVLRSIWKKGQRDHISGTWVTEHKFPDRSGIHISLRVDHRGLTDPNRLGYEGFDIRVENAYPDSDPRKELVTLSQAVTPSEVEDMRIYKVRDMLAWDIERRPDSLSLEERRAVREAAKKILPKLELEDATYQERRAFEELRRRLIEYHSK